MSLIFQFHANPNVLSLSCLLFFYYRDSEKFYFKAELVLNLAQIAQVRSIKIQLMHD